MHPAISVIFFTTASGAGYGLLALLGVAVPGGLLPAEPWLGVAALGLALALVSAGLLSSTFHLDHPERAWRAVSQWRSSWLSREGVAALATYLPAGLFGIGWVFLGTAAGIWALFGLLAAAGAVVTVYCTAMIYRSLKPIRHWHNGWVAPVYLAFAAMTGAMWLGVLVRLFGPGAAWVDGVALLAIGAAWALKAGYWRHVDGGTSASTPETATGLGALGPVRLLDPPHSQENDLTREMGFRIARKHAHKLRRLAVLLGGAVPAALTLALLVAPSSWPATLVALAAALAASAGTLIERWLFFAEARHTVSLYYGARAA